MRLLKGDECISDIQGQLYGMESDPVPSLLRFESFHDQQYVEIKHGGQACPPAQTIV